MKNKKLKSLIYLTVFVLLYSISYILYSIPASAQEKLTLSITPPLFQLNIGPGEFWASSLKVVNTNPYDLTLYASVMNFEGRGERGGGAFTPIIEEDAETARRSLAAWIEVSDGPIFVPEEQSVDIPFVVRIPDNAAPGGHYAAILVGTRPALNREAGSSVSISSLVSSLFFVRIKGDVREEGYIREFRAEKRFYQNPEATFTLRFENTGTVHLQPQGDIVIYNMWGKERGRILVNQKTHFGNVLPQSIRKFSFTWQGEKNPFEAGKYKAIATLGFGEEARQSVSRTTHFWVVPIKPVLGILGSFITFILFVMLVIRAYIRKALAVEAGKRNLTGVRLPVGRVFAQKAEPFISQIKTLKGPITEGIVDLRSLRDRARQPQKNTQKKRKKFHVYLTFVLRFSLAILRKYYIFFVIMTVLIGGVIGLFFYFGETLVLSRNFTVINQQQENDIILIEEFGE